MIFIGPRAPAPGRPRLIEPCTVNGEGGLSLPWPGDRRLRITFGGLGTRAIEAWMDRRYPR